VKVRSGFVSNSSTSSFIITAPTSVFSEKLNQVHPFIRHIIQKSRPKKQLLGGIEITQVHDIVSTEEDEWREEWLDEGKELPPGWKDSWQGTSDAWYEFMKMFKPKEAIIVSECCG
jgi:hypothetical protein